MLTSTGRPTYPTVAELLLDAKEADERAKRHDASGSPYFGELARKQAAEWRAAAERMRAEQAK